jgi:hypothetical protein
MMMQESKIRSVWSSSIDGSGGFGGGGHGGMNMDDFSQFGDILVVPLVVAADLAAEAEVSVKGNNSTYQSKINAGRDC